MGLPAVVWVLPSHGAYYVVRHHIGRHPQLVTKVYWAVLGGMKVVLLSQLILPIGITSTGRVLMLSTYKAFLISNVWTPTFLVLFIMRIGDPSAQLSVVMIVLLTGALGRQRTPFIARDGSVNVWPPHPAHRGSHLRWVHQIFLLIPPVVNS